MAHYPFRRGDPWTAETANELWRRTEPAVIRTSGGLTSRSDGRAINVTVDQPLRFVGVANGNITPRSGSTWGTGSVTRWQITDQATGAAATTSQSFDVLNPSATTMTSGNGINNGQYCWVEEDSDGNLIVTPLECS